MAYTSFFRDRDVLDLIVRFVLPAVQDLPEVKIWDAGCASGEEPYSLALLCAENLGPFAVRKVRIIATDREESNFPQFARIIAEGVYHGRDLAWVPEDLRGRYFQPAEKEGCFRIDSLLRGMVSYAQHDLLTLKPVDTGFSLVVCKNVLLHFSPGQRVEVLRMFHEVLRPPGFLALDFHQELPTEAAGWFVPVTRDGKLFRKA